MGMILVFKIPIIQGEFVPVLVYREDAPVKDLGIRDGFNQVSVSIMDFLGYPKTFGSESLL